MLVHLAQSPLNFEVVETIPLYLKGSVEANSLAEWASSQTASVIGKELRIP